MANKGRSRNFPVFGLNEAIQKVKQLFEKEGKAKTDPKTAVKAWGYSSLNGASLRVLGALRQYGLIDDIEDGLKVSDTAITLIHGTGPDKLVALRRAATTPKIFSELLEEFKNVLPSDDTLRANLITKKGFIPKSADLCIEAFRETIMEAKLQDNGYINAQEEERNGGSEEGTEKQQTTGEKRKQKTENALTFDWTLAPGINARLEISGNPSEEDKEFLKLCLDRAMKKLLESKSESSEKD